jgi:hypothetical protein
MMNWVKKAGFEKTKKKANSNQAELCPIVAYLRVKNRRFFGVFQ